MSELSKQIAVQITKRCLRRCESCKGTGGVIHYKIRRVHGQFYDNSYREICRSCKGTGRQE